MAFKKREKIVIFCEGKKWIVRLDKEKFSTHLGEINLKEVRKKEEGDCLVLKGRKFFFFKPTIDEFLRNLKRTTQIIYPKDLAFITFYADVKPTDNIIEAGTGSGSLLIALLRIVKKGKVRRWKTDAGYVYILAEKEGA